MRDKLYYYKAECIRVIDGDTIHLNIDLGFDMHHKSRIRLIGIDTPEVRHRDLIHKKAGKLVTEYVKYLIEDKPLYLYSKEFNQGKYGRILGDIYFEKGGEYQSLCENLANNAYAKHSEGKADWSIPELSYIHEQLIQFEDCIH